MLDYECCKGCEKPKRYPGCQGPKCPEWVEYDERIKAKKEIIKKNKDDEKIYTAAKVTGVNRYRRRIK